MDVHRNMGPKERAEKREGIVRPYSFRVWTMDADPKLVRIIVFELAYFEGELGTAAIGEMTQGSHSNFGTMDPKSDFAIIKGKVLKLIQK